MVNEDSKEDMVECPIGGCDTETLARGLYMHIFQTDDPEEESHYPRGEVPSHIDEEEIKVTGKKEVELDYPDEQDLEDARYLDTYTGKAYKGKRGLMVHLGQLAGKNNIPEDVTERHDATDFPIVETDKNGNITDVLKWPEESVPPLEPYLPWYDDEEDGYVSRRKISKFIDEIRNSSTGAASPDAIEKALLNDS